MSNHRSHYSSRNDWAKKRSMDFLSGSFYVCFCFLARKNTRSSKNLSKAITAERRQALYIRQVGDKEILTILLLEFSFTLSSQGLDVFVL